MENLEMKSKKNKNKVFLIIIIGFILIVIFAVALNIYFYINKNTSERKTIKEFDSVYNLENVDLRLKGETAFGSTGISIKAINHRYELYAINENFEKFSLGTFDLEKNNIDFTGESLSDVLPKFVGVINSRVYFIILYHSAGNDDKGRLNVYSIDLNSYNSETNSFDSIRTEYEKIDLNFSKNPENDYLGLINHDLIFRSSKDLNDDGFPEIKYVSSLNIDTGITKTLFEKETNDSFYKDGYFFYIDESGEKICAISLISNEEKEIFDAGKFITEFYIDGNILKYETGVSLNTGYSYSTGNGTYEITNIQFDSVSDDFDVSEDGKELLLNNKKVYKSDDKITILATASNNVLFVSNADGDENLYKYSRETNKVETFKEFFYDDYNYKYFDTELEYIKEYND